MATLDTALLIQPAVTPVPITTLQSKSAEGFHQLLEDETSKVSHPAQQPKAVGSRPAREAPQPANALQPAGRRPMETKTQPGRDAHDARLAAKPEAGAGKARSEAPAKATQRSAATQDSQRDATGGLTEVEAESTQRQDLPSEMAEAVSGPSVSVPEETVAKTAENEVPAPVAQAASVAALLASLLVQTTGNLKGTQIAVEAEPPVAESSAVAGLRALPSDARLGASSSDAGAWISSVMPISPEVLDGTPLAASAPGVPPGVVSEEAPSLGLPDALNPAMSSAIPAKAAPGESSPLELATATVGTAMTGESPMSEIRTSEPAAPVLAPAGKPAVAEKPQKPGKSRQELAGKEELPKLEGRPELLTSRPLPQPGAETAAGDTPQREPSYSDQKEAKPEGSEIVHNLKSAVVPNKEIPRGQPLAHTEIQEAMGNVMDQATELTSLPGSQGIAAKAPSETAFNTAVGATETASSVVRVPQPAAPAGLAEATGKMAGTSHSNVNWSQVEKAQMVSQIVERAHLLGKHQSELMVVLKPEFFGKVNLHAAMVDNQLVATIVAESASVRQMLESQLSSLQTALHEQGLPVAKVEVVQGSQLSFADLGAGQSSSQRHLESGKSQLPPPVSRYETGEESVEAIPLEAHIYRPPTSRSLNVVA